MLLVRNIPPVVYDDNTEAAPGGCLNMRFTEAKTAAMLTAKTAINTQKKERLSCRNALVNDYLKSM